ncbi:MAG: hypothetical protein E7667_07735 [Ruminococcaceae bacterium]|nr:hypothetical protein [Oscillospiraceae bacterium]
MDFQNKYKTEKLGKDEKKKKADLERRTGVPDPPVPNRAHTQMSSNPFGQSPFYVNTKKRDKEESIKKHIDKE